MTHFTPLDDRLFELAGKFLHMDPLLDEFIDDFISDVVDVGPLATSFASLIATFGSMDSLELSMQESINIDNTLSNDELKRQRQITMKCLELMKATIDRYKSIEFKIKINEHKFNISLENLNNYYELKLIIKETLETYQQRSIDMKTCMVGLFYLNSLHNLYKRLSDNCETI